VIARSVSGDAGTIEERFSAQEPRVEEAVLAALGRTAFCGHGTRDVTKRGAACGRAPAMVDGIWGHSLTVTVFTSV